MAASSQSGLQPNSLSMLCLNTVIDSLDSNRSISRVYNIFSGSKSEVFPYRLTRKVITRLVRALVIQHNQHFKIDCEKNIYQIHQSKLDSLLHYALERLGN